MRRTSEQDTSEPIVKFELLVSSSRIQPSAFHRRLREVVEGKGMTFATCQELSAPESDSPGIPHCERFLLPFSAKQPDGCFRPIEGCTAYCHVSCKELAFPPCGQPKLATHKPYKIRYLRSAGLGLSPPSKLIVIR